VIASEYRKLSNSRCAAGIQPDGTLGVVAMPTILCIDDDANILELQKSILETNGYAVVIAADGPTGISLASKHPVDVVVLDFKMPGMDGGQVAEVLMKQQPDLPIVICTGFFDAVPEWLRWFAAAYLQKGDGPEALLSALRELIASKKVAGQAGGTSPGSRQGAAA
jgi:CheY-like chemotaxis protein